MLTYIKNNLPILLSPTGKAIGHILSANFISAGVGFLTSIIILRNLSSDAISILYPLIGMMLICAQIGDLGVTQSFIKIASKILPTDRKKSLEYFHVALKTKLALAVIIFVLGSLLSSKISHWLLNSEKYAFLISLTLFITIFQITSTYFTSSLQIEGKFKTISFIRTIPPILKLCLITFLYLFEILNLETTLIAFFLIPVLATGAGLIYSTKDVYQSSSSLNHLKEIAKYAKWIFIASLCSTAIGQVDILMIKKMSTVNEVSILVGGQRLASILPLFTTALVTILLPKVSTMSSTSELNYFFRKSLGLIPIILIALVVLAFSAKFIIITLLGDRYVDSVLIFQIYIIGFGISVFITPLSLILYRLNQEYVFAILAFSQLLINIIGNYFLIPSYDSAGAAAMSSVIKLLGLIVTLALLYKHGIIFYHKKK